ncbi:bifunctional riboflavin kinase/FAD synthetase [Leucobacter soli]|uniref:Riboflavin biosynthesis protein n=1 Tax=Leucobacter soli TaxID=2812850 RepID=A0A916JUT9_9MICO|nr:bifunctional riboflavin kinase/FAD synthetase [Leucobacter soli]CAG7604427.1 Bifunctional riboflavin kinase/FMN adenylyltransferase [Leucobacter soli]
MRVYRSLDAIPADAFAGGTAVAIGKFDGVHLGHRALVRGIAEAAEQRGLEPVVFTFENNPLSLLRPDICPVPIMSTQQRIDALAGAGATTCVIVPFDEALAAVPAEEFMARILVDTLHARHLSFGRDFRFGHGGAGDAALLERSGERLGFTVEVLEQVEDPELGRVSSSRVREAILQGDVDVAARMMGGPVSVRSIVVHGDARGRELGFPTANLGDPIEGLVPAHGVYAGWAIVGGRQYEAAISVGVNLTFGADGPARVEANLLDFSGDIYGEEIEVRFAERLRGMVAFSGIDALIERIQEDVRQTRVILLGQDSSQ